ncbi:hypothetical protein F5Y16DRAFT_389032 [Xylariaceae sp. FL0255]|nr:hypothetical protein F5Y16DRAFT_389032 [Xylariaceae sp. FL0255]
MHQLSLIYIVDSQSIEQDGLDGSNISPEQLAAILDGPALTPPAGVTPMFANPPNENTLSLLALFLCLSAASVALCIRVYVRFFKLKQVHPGGYLAVVAYAAYAGMLIGSFRRIFAGPGLFVHQCDIRERDMPEYLLTIFIGAQFYSVAVLVVKTAILTEWTRTVVPLRSHNVFALSSKLLWSVNAVFYIVMIISCNLICQPCRRIWDRKIPGHCIDYRILSLASAIFNLILDLTILALPHRVILTLQMSRAKRVGMSMVFAIGIGACGSSASRIKSTIQ